MLKRIVALALLFCLLTASASAAVYETEDGRKVILAIGGHFVYVMDTEGRLRVCGDNQFGQLGKGSNKQSFAVQEFTTKNAEIDISHIKNIISTTDYSFMWMDDDTVWGVGNNAYLSLTKPEGTYSTHVKVALPEKPAAIALGFGHVLMLTENGEVYAWGRNGEGQVGNGGTRKTQNPVKLPLQNIVQIVAGGKFSLALDADGQLWGWGDNEYHTILPNTTKNQLTPVKINTGDIDIAYIEACGASVVLLDKDGVLWTWGRNDMQQLGYDTKGKTTSSPQAVPLPLPVSYVDAYSSQTAAILTDGSLWTWGNNSYGQLGQGFRSSSPEGVLPGKCWDSDVAIVLNGSLCMIAMLEDGTVLTSGISKFGELGEGNDKSKYTLSPNGMDLIVD